MCNGITDIQRTILSRLGITTRELSSGTHSFLLTETDEGNIITDATWDLSNTLYQGRPRYFGVTYEQLRKNEEGISNAHRLETPPENVIEISDQELREIYHSIGLTTEDRKFIFPILSEVENIEQKGYTTLEAKIEDFTDMFPKKFSKEASHLSETRTLLEAAISSLGIDWRKIKTKFVYSQEDQESENPYLIFHIDDEQMKDTIRIMDLKESEFKSMTVKEFDEKYKLHDLDITQPFWKQYIKDDVVKINETQER